VRFAVFGTTAVLLVTDPAALSRARAITDQQLAAVDEACSRFRPDSEISRLNFANGRLFAVSELLWALIAEAVRAAEVSDGAVDPTVAQALIAAETGRPPASVPGWRNVALDQTRRAIRLDHGAQLDLGATAKAWAADRCGERIAAELGCGVLVSLGGDIAVAGPAPETGWQVKVADDHAADPKAPGPTVTIRSGGLATSSTTVRGPHIIDPATGAPAEVCWRTVSVAAETCTDANIASTAAIVKGEAAPQWLTGLALPARLVRPDGSELTTAGWPSR
jgi:thiamine biosynthesis lipoprotein